MFSPSLLGLPGPVSVTHRCMRRHLVWKEVWACFLSLYTSISFRFVIRARTEVRASVFSFVKWKIVCSQSSEASSEQWLACARDTLKSFFFFFFHRKRRVSALNPFFFKCKVTKASFGSSGPGSEPKFCHNTHPSHLILNRFMMKIEAIIK